MKRNEFKTYHPIVNFLYFIIVIGFSCIFMHPICLCISFFSAFLYSVMLKSNIKLKYLLIMFVGMAILNPVFNHEGVTILSYFPSGNPLTLESIVYGVFASIMLLSVICWFSCYNEIMTSDKFIYLFGRIIPSLSLVLSMTLRFVPRFTKQMKAVAATQKTMGRDIASGGIIKRAKNALTILSVMVTWSLENALDTADSMKARGYGIEGRTSFSIFTFDKRDKRVLILILILALYIVFGAFFDVMYFSYFPIMTYSEISVFSVSVFLSYLLLLILPVLIELWEAKKWNALKSKI